jgi:hypothetical protein
MGISRTLDVRSQPRFSIYHFAHAMCIAGFYIFSIWQLMEISSLKGKIEEFKTLNLCQDGLPLSKKFGIRNIL